MCGAAWGSVVLLEGVWFARGSVVLLGAPWCC